MIHRVLIVEDHELWRRHLFAALQHTPQWQIVGDASDGLEAVRMADELKPDLILLDVGLPTISGIQAAQRMLANNPSVRILFVSEQQSWDVAESALTTGARGYLLKSDVGRDLSRAMEAVAGGRRFVSARLAGRVVEGTSDARVALDQRRHEARFYPDESSLLDDYADFAGPALDGGSTFVAFVTNARRDKLRSRLQARGVDVDGAISDGRFVSVDMAAALSSFLVDGRPDATRFWNAAHSLMMRAASASKTKCPCVVACGDCAGALVAEGNASAAIRLEQLWDEVARTYDIDTLCGYSLDVPHAEEQSHIFQELCAVHSAVHTRAPAAEDRV